MYNVGDVVMFNSLGVCRILKIAQNQTDAETEKYYVLEPIYDQCSTSVFIPVKDEKLTAKIRSIATVNEILNIIEAVSKEDLIWIEDENERIKKYREIIENGSRTELVNLIKTIHILKHEQKDKGRKINFNDSVYLKKAEKIISSEFAFVLKIEPKDVIDFIIKQMKKENVQC